MKEERVRPDASEVERLLCDNVRIEGLTGWKPEVTLEEGLEKTIEWLKENLGLYKPGIYNV